eukprot:scaffold1505_cov390-Prasinococcus_capsulatus_cf.AAC.2
MAKERCGIGHSPRRRSSCTKVRMNASQRPNRTGSALPLIMRRWPISPLPLVSHSHSSSRIPSWPSLSEGVVADLPRSDSCSLSSMQSRVAIMSTTQASWGHAAITSSTSTVKASSSTAKSFLNSCRASAFSSNVGSNADENLHEPTVRHVRYAAPSDSHAIRTSSAATETSVTQQYSSGDGPRRSPRSVSKHTSV